MDKYPGAVPLYRILWNFSMPSIQNQHSHILLHRIQIPMNRWRSNFYLYALIIESRADSYQRIAFVKYCWVALPVFIYTYIYVCIRVSIYKMMRYPSCLNGLFQKICINLHTAVNMRGFLLMQELLLYRLITERWNPQEQLPLLRYTFFFLIEKCYTNENRQNSKSIHFLCFDKISKKGQNVMSLKRSFT